MARSSLIAASLSNAKTCAGVDVVMWNLRLKSGKGVNTDGRSSTTHNHEDNFLLKHSKKEISDCTTMS